MSRNRKTSIEEVISHRLVWVGLVVLVLTALLTILLFRSGYNRQVKEDMSITARVLAAALEEGCSPEELASVEEVRLTLIDPDGTVLYDSASSGEENHLSRPEVQQAIETGEGFVQRQSDTVGYNTTYYALALENGDILRLAYQTASTYAIYDSSFPAVIGICLLIMVLALFLSSALSKRIVRPMEEMAHQLDTLTEETVPYRELEPFAQAIHQDYLLRKENEEMRAEFTANVSHELKTPLTSISGYAELLENGMAGPEAGAQFGGKIHKEASRMLALVEDILQLSNLDGKIPGDPTVVRESLDLSELAQDTVQRLTFNAQRAYVTIRVQTSGAPVMGSPKLLDELVYNLVDNAIRYNRPGGTVTIQTGTQDGHSYFKVSDTGIGIPKEEQGRIFERFYRVDKSRSKATGGTGLGLAIVKHIAALHRANITLTSQLGEGTTIRVTF